MQLLDKYKADVSTLLETATPENFATVVRAIELSSHYMTLALGSTQLDAASQDDTGDYGAAKALLDQMQPKPATSAQADAMADVALEPAAPANENTGAVAPAPTDEFKVERKLIGAIAGNHFFTEAAVRDLDLADGDTVRISDDDDFDGEEEVTIIERNRSTAEPNIETMTGAVIERDDTLPADYAFYADKDVHGDVLMRTNDDLPFTFLIKPNDAARLALRSGDIVDLSWYRTDGPQVATVTWVYKDKQGLKPVRHVAKPKKKQAKAEANANADADATPIVTAKTYDPQIKFTLDGKKILLIGNVKSLPGLKAVITAHNGGTVVATDATKGAQLKHKLERTDVAVLITDEVHHITTNTSVKIAKKLRVPYAVANSDAPLNVERALYRALSGMPAYEPSAGDFDYPEV